LVKEDIKNKVVAPGGATLLIHVGYVYIQEAKSHAGRFFGLEGWVAGVQNTGHLLGEGIAVISDLKKMSQIQKEMERSSAAAAAGGAGGGGGDVGGGGPSADVQQKAMNTGMSLMWRLGKFEIEKEVRAVCETVFKEFKTKKDEKKKAAEALRKLGEMYHAAGKKAAGGGKGAPPTLDDLQNVATSKRAEEINEDGFVKLSKDKSKSKDKAETGGSSTNASSSGGGNDAGPTSGKVSTTDSLD